MNQKLERTFTAYDPTVILARLVSLKDIRVVVSASRVLRESSMCSGTMD
ncbi:hypothetical protein [Arcanobacterium pinnipediorum]|uniref:Uncharacterized protein n=1 Tax=Arcanobacterium pinnipediorum TaxID=1503041 RepID=A0ABY5AI69_9ACTO|nr:hypothetical protein [Arcanobacterium pinnipediorum]USR79907.1 hypothetical protein NG665_02695 [Arcanobacterium pinnipediorum]